MADLTCSLAGIESPNPFWLASGPPASRGDLVKRAFDRGWGGAVWKTLCPEPVKNVSPRLSWQGFVNGRPLALGNIELIMDRPLAENLREISSVKASFPDRALVASVMAGPREEWFDLVRRAEDAGVDALELNFGCPHGMCERGMGSAVGQEPALIEEITSWIRGMTTLPLVVKLTPNVTDILEPASAAVRGGAGAISLINTINSIMGVDLDRFVPLPAAGGKGTHGGMSGPAVKPVALHMVREVCGAGGPGVEVSAIGGVAGWRDAAEFILLGASNVQVCTAVMLRGFGIVEEMVEGLSSYMDAKGFASIGEMRGRALPNSVTFGELDAGLRAVPALDAGLCIGCGVCVASCRDAGAGCIIPSPGPAPSAPSIDAASCTGCGLCAIVCPVEGCLKMECA